MNTRDLVRWFTWTAAMILLSCSAPPQTSAPPHDDDPATEAGAGTDAGAAPVAPEPEPPTAAGGAPAGFTSETDAAGAPAGAGSGVVAPFLRQPLMIGPVGDSLTANRGATDENGWRKYIYDQAQQAGYPLHFFGKTASGTFPENRHSSISGCDIACSSAASALNFGPDGPFYDLPGVVMVLIGSADIINGTDPAVAAAAYKIYLVERFIQVVPHLQAIVVATIPPLRGDPPAAAAYNAALQGPGGVWDQLEIEYSVRLARIDAFKAMGGHYDPTLYADQSSHPNDAGYARIGEEYWRGVGPLFDELTREPSR